MAITTTDIAHNFSASAVASLAVTVPGGGVPAGATIIVGCVEGNTSATSMTVTDTAGNTYTRVDGLTLNGLAANGKQTAFYCVNCLALSSGNSITYTCSASNKCALTAMYATGVYFVDTSVTGSGRTSGIGFDAFASNNQQTSFELLVAFGAWVSTLSGFVQDGAWSDTPPTTTGTGNTIGVVGGRMISAGNAFYEWHPSGSVTGGAGSGVASMMLGFMEAPRGWEATLFQPPQRPSTRERSAGTKHRAGFAIIPNAPPIVFDSPAHYSPRPKRDAALIHLDEGAVFKPPAPPPIFTKFWFDIPFMPPALIKGRSVATKHRAGFTYAPTTLGGWEIPYFHVARLLGKKSAAIEGTSEFAVFKPLANGWDTILAFLRHPQPERSGAVAFGDTGIQAVYIPTVIPKNWGQEPVLHYGPHPKTERSGATAVGDSGITNVFNLNPPALPIHWFENTLHYYPHPHTERGIGATAIGDFGAYFREQVIPPPAADFYHMWRKPPRLLEAAMKVRSGYRIFQNLVPMGWEVQPPQPPNPLLRKQLGSVAIGDDGIALPPLSFVPAGVGGVTVNVTFISHICTLPGPGPAINPVIQGPGAKIC